jgi:hypothetical protein
MATSHENPTLIINDYIAQLQQIIADIEGLAQAGAVRICKAEVEVFTTALRQEVDCALEIGQVRLSI